MIFSSKIIDLLIATLIPFVFLAFNLIFGDALYAGVWYYFAVFYGAVILTSFFRPIAFFQTGVAVGIAITLLEYLSINWLSARPEGLLMLGHLFYFPEQ